MLGERTLLSLQLARMSIYSEEVVTIFEHPIWRWVAPHAHLGTVDRDNLDFLELSDQLRELAIGVITNCISCGEPCHPMRARATSNRSRIAGTPVERRLFYAPTCPTEVNPGCSRTKSAKRHKRTVRQQLALLGLLPAGIAVDDGLVVEDEDEVPGHEIETYSALCLKEPYLELILLGIKTLETRTKCLFKDARELVLTSSSEIDDVAWVNPASGRKLDDAAQARALNGLGKVRGIVRAGGFRPGIPGVEDSAACIGIALLNGTVRQVCELTQVRRVIEVPVKRVRPEGDIVDGSLHGIFKVPRAIVQFPGGSK